MKTKLNIMKYPVFMAFAFAVCTAQAAPVESWLLPNGGRVLFVENHALPIVDINVNVDAGARRDVTGKSGVSSMTCAMLMRGISSDGDKPALDEAKISDAIADIAAEIGCSVEEDRAVLTLRTLSSQPERDAAVLLAARAMAQPTFPRKLLSREKARTVAVIKEADTKPSMIADKAFRRAMYGAHPYGERPTVESIEAIERDDLLTFHRIHYVSDRTVVAIVGDVTRDQADTLARQLTMRLPQASVPMMAIPEVLAPRGEETRVTHPASQAHIMIGLPALRRADPDYFTISVGNYILGGGGFVSRLVHEVREKRGLAYSVRSNFTPMMQEGPFQIGLQTKKEQSDEAIKVVRKTLGDFLRDGPTEAEMKAAKNYMIGGFALYIDTNSKMMANVSAIGYYGLPLDYLDTWKQNVAAVTAEEVREAFKRKIDPDRMVTVIVGAPE
jgi:zinc protease